MSMITRSSRTLSRLCASFYHVNTNQITRWKASHARLLHTGTLPSNKAIYHFPDPVVPGQHILTLLSTAPPTSNLYIGTTVSIPPKPSTFTSNPAFLPILHSVLAQHAINDPIVRSAAQTYASETGFVINSTRHGANSSGAGPTAFQGGSGGGGRGGWVHVSDQRRPPDWGRIADPEDILGSVEVDAHGEFVGANGNYQDSGTYRIITNEGILDLSPFLMEKLVERLKYLERTGETL